MFFVMHGFFETRKGLYGHYIKPYTVDANDLCVPYPLPAWYDENATDLGAKSARGYPGLSWEVNAKGESFDYNLEPNLNVCKNDIDFVVASDPAQAQARFYEIGRETLRQAVKSGEELDLEFAYKMQGLLGCTLETVWACLDPSFNPADRGEIMNRFVAGYTDGFFKKISWEDQQDPRAVATEELQQHKAWCQVGAHACL